MPRSKRGRAAFEASNSSSNKKMKSEAVKQEVVEMPADVQGSSANVASTPDSDTGPAVSRKDGGRPALQPDIPWMTIQVLDSETRKPVPGVLVLQELRYGPTMRYTRGTCCTSEGPTIGNFYFEATTDQMGLTGPDETWKHDGEEREKEAFEIYNYVTCGDNIRQARKFLTERFDADIFRPKCEKSIGGLVMMYSFGLDRASESGRMGEGCFCLLMQPWRSYRAEVLVNSAKGSFTVTTKLHEASSV